MGGLDNSSKRKRDKRAVDMSMADELDQATPWRRPSDEELDSNVYDLELPGADVQKDRLLTRLDTHAHTYEIVEFSLIQQTWHHGRWVEVAEADSCHNTDCHVHQCGKKARGRTGEANVLVDIGTLEEVGSAYEVALHHMNDNWRVQRDRWEHG